jgi:hypothetical protein
MPIPLSTSACSVWRPTACSRSFLGVSISIIVPQIGGTVVYVFVGDSRAARVIFGSIFVVNLESSRVPTSIRIVIIPRSLGASRLSIGVWGSASLVGSSVFGSISMFGRHRGRITRAFSVLTVNGGAIELRQRRSCLHFTPSATADLSLIRTG